MLIRKLFKYEASHQVYDAYSRRCSYSIHGHSYVVEFIFEGNTPDSAQMVMDFGFVKRYFHSFVDAFDHAHILMQGEKYNDAIDFFTKNNERWVKLPFNSTAEMQAKMFFMYGNMVLRYLRSRKIIDENIKMHSVKVHETDTGYAEFRASDFHSCHFPRVELDTIIFSDGIKNEWNQDFKEFYNDLIQGS